MLENAGWQRGTPQDGGVFYLHAKPFPSIGMTAVVEYDGVPVGYMVDWDDQSIERAYVVDGLVTPDTLDFGSRWRKGDKRLKWRDVDPIVRSEVLADIATIMEKAQVSDARQRPPAEDLYADELARLSSTTGMRPARPAGGSRPRASSRSSSATQQLRIAPKFVGSRSFVERCVVALATNRGLMLVGEPGTAKSYLSELLAAAVSGDSTLTIQGSARPRPRTRSSTPGTTRCCSPRGRRERSLVPAPLCRACARARSCASRRSPAARSRCRTRCSRCSRDRVLTVPELEERDACSRPRASTSSPPPTPATAASTR